MCAPDILKQAHVHVHEICTRTQRLLPLVGLAAGLALMAACGAPTPSGGASSPVTIITDQQRYSARDTVTATITNGVGSDILAADHQSNCTIVTIQRQDGQTWQPQNPCALKSATRLITLAPGSVTAQPLAPPASAAAGWAPGTYRIAFTYQTTQSGPETTLYSAQFTIG